MKQYLIGFWKGLIRLYPLGLSLFWLAPVIPLLSVIPEFAQHVAEIRIGMFDSLEAAKTLQNDPLRWAFGYAKIAGLWLAILASARFCWLLIHQDIDAARRGWWRLSDVAWGQFMLALLANVLASAVPFAIQPYLDKPLFDLCNAAFMILTLPLFIWLFGAFLGDRQMGLHRSFTLGWFAVLPMALFTLLGFMPGQWLHGMNHQWAMGAGPGKLWGLMVFDSLLVGAMAVLVGAGTALGYGIAHSSSSDPARFNAKHS